MKLEIDELKNRWKEARGKMPAKPASADKIIEMAENKRKTALSYQYGNVAVMAGTMVIVIVFLHFLYPFGEILSHVGTVMMWGGLLVRITVEFYSITKSRRIQLAEQALKTVGDTVRYYAFRKRVHGPVTVALVVVYIVGFALLTPEMLRYVETKWVIFFDSLFAGAAIFLVWQIRKGIRDELTILKEMVSLKQELVQNDEQG